MSGTSLTLNPGGGLSIGGQNLQKYGPNPSEKLPTTFSPSSAIADTGLPGSLSSPSPSIFPTPTGGLSFDSSLAKGFNTTPKPKSPIASAPVGTLADYINNTSSSPNGGQLITNGNGVPQSFNPNYGLQIDTSGSIPSNALSSNISTNDLTQQHNQYSDYVNALAQAQGYSPDYVNALQQQYQAQTQGAELNLNSAALNSNLYTGNNLPGDTMNYAQGATAKAQAQNTLGQAQNSIQQLSANQGLNTQALLRSGNIAAAQTQLQSSPGGMSGQNAINQYNTLQQQYPNANIPSYNPNLSPEQNQQLANQIVSQSPAYQAQFQQTYQTPGGGLGTYSKLNPSGGGSEIVSGADAATGAANASSLATQTQNYNNTQSAFNTANKTLGTMIDFMQKNGINDNSVPILNQLQNKVNAGLVKPGVVAAYQADIAELQTNYAQILSRGGSVAGTNDEANQLINPNLKPADLQKVLGELTRNGQNAIDSLGQQIGSIKSQLGGISSSQSSSNSEGWY